MSTEESFNNSAQAAKDLKNVKQADMLTLYGLYKVGMTGAGPEGDRPWGVEGGMKYDAHSSASRKHNNSKLAAQNAYVTLVAKLGGPAASALAGGLPAEESKEGGELDASPPDDPYRAHSWKNTLSGETADGPPCLKSAKELDEEIKSVKLTLKDQKKKTAAAHEDLKAAKSSTKYYMSHVIGGDGGHEEHELAIQGHKEAEDNHGNELQRLQSLKDKQLEWEKAHWFSMMLGAYTTSSSWGCIAPDAGESVIDDEHEHNGDGDYGDSDGGDDELIDNTPPPPPTKKGAAMASKLDALVASDPPPSPPRSPQRAEYAPPPPAEEEEEEPPPASARPNKDELQAIFEEHIVQGGHDDHEGAHVLPIDEVILALATLAHPPSRAEVRKASARTAAARPPKPPLPSPKAPPPRVMTLAEAKELYGEDQWASFEKRDRMLILRGALSMPLEAHDAPEPEAPEIEGVDLAEFIKLAERAMEHD